MILALQFTHARHRRGGRGDEGRRQRENRFRKAADASNPSLVTCLQYVPTDVFRDQARHRSGRGALGAWGVGAKGGCRTA